MDRALNSGSVSPVKKVKLDPCNLAAKRYASFFLGHPVAYRDFHPTHPILPLIAFEHLSLYMQKHLGQSVAVCGSLWKGRSWQTKAKSGTAGYRLQSCKSRYSQVQPGTARYGQVQC